MLRLMDWYHEGLAFLFSLQNVVKAELAGHVRTVAESGHLAPAIVILAFGLGMVHALTPGHGKVVVVSYFMGNMARPVEGFSMAARVAFSHTVSAIILVLLFGKVVSIVGRPTGAADTVQTAGYGLIAIIGAYYLYRAFRPSQAHPHERHNSILPYAIGVLPCPLTMLVVGQAVALGAYVTGLTMAGLMGCGAAFTIGMFGTLGIIARRGLLRKLDPQSRTLGVVLSGLEIGSSAVILGLGVSLFIGNLAAR